MALLAARFAIRLGFPLLTFETSFAPLAALYSILTILAMVHLLIYIYLE